jgi:hypothetical protein
LLWKREQCRSSSSSQVMLDGAGEEGISRTFHRRLVDGGSGAGNRNTLPEDGPYGKLASAQMRRLGRPDDKRSTDRSRPCGELWEDWFHPLGSLPGLSLSPIVAFARTTSCCDPPSPPICHPPLCLFLVGYPVPAVCFCPANATQKASASRPRRKNKKKNHNRSVLIVQERRALRQAISLFAHA